MNKEQHQSFEVVDGTTLQKFLAQNFVLSLYRNGKDGYYCGTTRQYILFDSTKTTWDKASILELFKDKTANPSEVEYAKLILFIQSNNKA